MPAHPQMRALAADPPRRLAQAQRACAIAALEAVARHVEQRDQRAVRAARRARDRRDLVGERGALDVAVGAAEREVQRVERVLERVGIAGGARDLHGAARDRRRALGRRPHVEIGEPRHQASLLDGARVAERGERLLDRGACALVEHAPLLEIEQPDRRARHLARTTERARELERGARAVSAPRPLAREPPRLCARERQLEAPLRVEPGHLLERLARLLGVQRRLIVRAQARGVLCGAQRRLAGALGIADRQRAVVMVSELGEHRRRIALVLALEVLGRAQVQARALRPARAPRARPPGTARARSGSRWRPIGAGSSTPASTASSTLVERVGARLLRHRAGREQLEVAPEHGRGRDQRMAAASESCSSGRRIRSSARAGSATLRACELLGLREGAALLEQTDRLAHEERHAFGACEELGGEIGRRGAAESPARAARRPHRARTARARARCSCPATRSSDSARATGRPGARDSWRTVASTSSGASSGS